MATLILEVFALIIPNGTYTKNVKSVVTIDNKATIKVH